MKRKIDKVVIQKHLNERGFFIFKDFFSPEQVSIIKKEMGWFLGGQHGDYLKLENKREGNGRGEDLIATISPLSLLKAGEFERLGFLKDLLLESEILWFVKSQLGDDAFLDRLIVHRTTETGSPVTEWHADQQKEGRRSFKFMVYLNDTGPENGAFSYVPGSHHLVNQLVSEGKRRNVHNQKIHVFSEMRQYASEFGMEGCKRELSQIEQHIRNDWESDDYYSLSAPAGSLLIFDTKGIHRGGVVSNGERFIVRAHFFEPTDEIRENQKSPRNRLKRLVSSQARVEQFLGSFN